MKNSKSLLLPVTGMSCAACAGSVESMLNTVNGVTSAKVNYASGSVDIKYNSGAVTLEKLKESIQSIGYDLIIEDEEDKKQKVLEEVKAAEYKLLVSKTVISLIFTIPIMVISMGYPDLANANIIMMMLTLPVILWSGRSFYSRAILQLRHKMVTMDTLVALSTAIAFIYSLVLTVFPNLLVDQGITTHVYYEASAVIISFVLIGKLLEERAKSQTSSAIKQLMKLQPDYVDVIDDNGLIKATPLKLILPGATILVKPGDQIPIDGEVVSGDSYIDESMITGEALPAHKYAGSKVFAGTLNQQGKLNVLAETKGSETLLAKIIETVKKAQGSKAEVQKLADKIASVFVPVVIGISMLTFMIWMIFGGDNSLSYALITSISVLVIACPCALGLATPTAIMVGMGRGAENQILIKDAVALENLARITTLVFDKTGTITKGKPEVKSIAWHIEDHNSELKELYSKIIKKLESYSDHPLSYAISAHFDRLTSEQQITEFKNIPGRGIQGTANSQQFVLGNAQLLKDTGVQINYSDNEEIGTNVYFADRKNHIATINIADLIKENTKEVIHQLEQAGLETWMLTGDNELTAKSVSESTGIKNYKAELLPNEKSAIIKQLQQNGRFVAMVGDGINDSEALAIADVGIAMGSGSDIALDVAQVTLRSNNLGMIEKAIALSQQTSRTIKQNLFWAFIYNLIGIPIAAGILYGINGFLLNPMFAAGAMALSSVSVVMNSLLLKKRPLVLKPKNSSTDKTNSMETYKFKTNINCNGCIAAVTPKLEALPEIKTWNVDIDNPDKILTVELDNSNSTKIKDAVESAGFSITQV